MDDFRIALEEEIFERSRVVIGSAGDAARLYRLLCMEAFLSGDGNSHIRQAMLMVSPEGEWRDRDHVDLVVPATQAYEENAVKKRKSKALAGTLTSRRFTYKLEGKWNEGEETFCELALVDMCHGLLRPAFVRYLLKKRN